MRLHEVLVRRLIDVGWRLGFYPVPNWSWIVSARRVDVAWLYPIEVINRLGVFAAFEVAISDMTSRKQLVASVSDLEEIPTFLRVLVAPVELAKDKNIAERYLDEIMTRHPKVSQIRENNLESTLTWNWILPQVQDATPPIDPNYQMAKDGLVYHIAVPSRDATPLVANLYVPTHGFPTWLYVPDPFFTFLKDLMKQGRKLGVVFDKSENKIVIGEGLRESFMKGFDREYRFLFIDEKSEVSKVLLNWGKVGLAYSRKGDNILIIPYQRKGAQKIGIEKTEDV